MDFPALPSFYEDPMFMKGQTDLYGLGTDFLKGNIPEYYKGIGEAGGPMFEDMLRLNRESITGAGYESAARMGTRGGATQSNILKAVRASEVPLRWADFTRSLEGRKGFLDTGVNAVTGVRNAGLQFGGQKNSFSLSTAQMAQQNAQFEMKMEAEKKAAKDKMWSDIISGGMAGLGFMMGGPMGAGAGASLGKMFMPGSAAKGTSGMSAGAMDFSAGGIMGYPDELDFTGGFGKSVDYL